jgi:hypothetical protein
MTAREMFDSAYLRVSNALGLEPDADQADECYRAVQGYAASLYDEAASRLGSRCRFMPKPVEWREALDEVVAEGEEDIRRERAEASQLRIVSRTYHCPTCHDTGWQPGRCTAQTKCGRCSKRGFLYDHDYVTECLCRPTNVVYQESIQRQRDRVPVAKGRTA